MASASASGRGRPDIIPVGFSTINDPKDANVDIVFVHGLQGHPEKTWTYMPPPERKKSFAFFFARPTKTPNGVFWPLEFLSKHPKLSRSRIITWGYDTHVTSFFSASNQQNVSRHGNDLMVALQRERKGDPSRPLIFVAHSLGGILVKIALDNSKRSEHQPQYLAIHRSTRGIIFLGTPHRGSPAADWGILAANLAKIALQGTNDKVLKALVWNSELLENWRNEFLMMVEDGNFKIHSFYESMPMSGGYGLQREVVPYESAQIGHAKHETVSSIHGNHLEICKFATSTDDGYKAVFDAIEDYLDIVTKETSAIPSEVRPSAAPSPATLHTRGHFHFPNRLLRGFVGREDILRRIEDGFASASAPRTVVLRGIGGQGKSQVALEYCHRSKSNKYQTIFWVDATSESTLKASFESISEQIKTSTEVFPDTDARVAFVLRKFADWPAPWLMVFDNYDNPGSFDSIQDFMPVGEHGAILFTSRHVDADALGHDGNAIELHGLQEKEALTLLFTQSKIEETCLETEHGKKIVERLGHHPLAIAQAAAYVRKRKIGLDEFMGHYNRRRKHILQETLRMSQYRRQLNESEKETSLSVFTTWELSFQQLPADEFEGIKKVHLLTLFAHFDCRRISERLFKSYCKKPERCKDGSKSASKSGTWLHNSFTDHQGNWDGDLFQDAVSDLRDLSLVQTFTREADGFCSLSLHPLVKDWIRLRADAKACQEHSLMAAEILSTLIMACRGNRKFEIELSDKQDILAHLNAHMENYRDFLGKDSMESGIALSDKLHAELIETESWLARFYSEAGRYTEAAQMYERAVAFREEMKGRDDLDTLRSVNSLAWVLQRQGKYDDAVVMMRRVLQVREELLGPDHVDTLQSITNLTEALYVSGKYAEAIEKNKQAHERKEKVLGPEHPDTLTTIYNLAEVFREQFNHTEAEKMHRRALVGREKNLGPDHPDTIQSLSCLADVLSEQGEYEVALDMSRQAWKRSENTLGVEHPDTLTCLVRLAEQLDDAGKFEEAEVLARLGLAGREKSLGHGHPSTIESVHGVAKALKEQHKYEEAESYNRRSLEGWRKTLGRDHVNTALTTYRLGILLECRGRYEEASEYYQEACRSYEKSVGVNHPRFLDCSKRYKSLLEKMKESNPDGEPFPIDLVPQENVTLGEDEPQTQSLSPTLVTRGKAPEEPNRKRRRDNRSVQLGEDDIKRSRSSETRGGEAGPQ